MDTRFLGYTLGLTFIYYVSLYIIVIIECYVLLQYRGCWKNNNRTGYIQIISCHHLLERRHVLICCHCSVMQLLQETKYCLKFHSQLPELGTGYISNLCMNSNKMKGFTKSRSLQSLNISEGTRLPKNIKSQFRTTNIV